MYKFCFCVVLSDKCAVQHIMVVSYTLYGRIQVHQSIETFSVFLILQIAWLLFSLVEQNMRDKG